MNLNENMIFLKKFSNIFLNLISDLKIWFSRSYIASLFLLFLFKNMTPKNCLTCNFSLQYQYILQPIFLRIKKLISWTVSNWRNTSFSKNISWDICYISKEDLARSWKLKVWDWVHHFILQTMISYSQVLSNKYLPESKIIWRLNPLALNVQCKTFQFFKAGKIVSKFIFYY